MADDDQKNPESEPEKKQEPEIEATGEEGLEVTKNKTPKENLGPLEVETTGVSVQGEGEKAKLAEGGAIELEVKLPTEETEEEKTALQTAPGLAAPLPGLERIAAPAPAISKPPRTRKRKPEAEAEPVAEEPEEEGAGQESTAPEEQKPTERKPGEEKKPGEKAASKKEGEEKPGEKKPAGKPTPTAKPSEQEIARDLAGSQARARAPIGAGAGGVAPTVGQPPAGGPPQTGGAPPQMPAEQQRGAAAEQASRLATKRAQGRKEEGGLSDAITSQKLSADSTLNLLKTILPGSTTKLTGFLNDAMGKGDPEKKLAIIDKALWVLSLIKKVASYVDGVIEFVKDWASWSVELYWWTIVGAIFDLIVVMNLFGAAYIIMGKISELVPGTDVAGGKFTMAVDKIRKLFEQIRDEIKKQTQVSRAKMKKRRDEQMEAAAEQEQQQALLAQQAQAE